jgi:hypothetical protein
MPTVQNQQRPHTVPSYSRSAQFAPEDSDTLASHTATMANSSNNTSHAATPAALPPKKGKGKKTADPVDTNKLLEQTVARLERDAAGDREQEAEIGRCWPRFLTLGQWPAQWTGPSVGLLKGYT